MSQNEIRWDKLLKIKTTGRDDSNADQYRYPYEPTPYSVIERLANSGYIDKNNILIDYGCGKGRVDFYLSYQLKCRTIGIEYDKRIYDKAVINQNESVSGKRTQFVNINAEEYEIPAEADCFYFFNPFSVELLQKVIARILDSYYESPRYMQLFFYYPSDEYVGYLMMQDQLMFSDEIDCRDLFEGNNTREKILIFEVND